MKPYKEQFKKQQSKNNGGGKRRFYRGIVVNSKIEVIAAY